MAWLTRKDLGSAQHMPEWAGGAYKHGVKRGWGFPFLCEEAQEWVWEQPAWSEGLPAVISCKREKWKQVSEAPAQPAGRLKASSGQHRSCNGPTVQGAMLVHPGAMNHLAGISGEPSGILLVFDIWSVRVLAGNEWLRLQPALSSPLAL